MIGNLSPYPQMKESGVDWLGQVPQHWQLRRLRASVNACTNGVWGDDPDGQNDLICVRVADFDRIRRLVDMRRKTLRAVMSSERRGRLLNNGDLLIEKSGGGDLQPVGAVVMYEHNVPAVCSNFVARMPVAAGFDPRYLTYLHSSMYEKRVNVRSIKQTTGIQNLDSSRYLSEQAAFPPLPEQTTIVRFLDYADRRIQRYIRAKQKLIALLEEKKQAIINEAVTGRIDVRTERPYPAYKGSGVEWLGAVPEHWTWCRLRNVVSVVTTGSRGWSSYASDTGPLFIRIANLSRGSLQLQFDDAVRLNLPSTPEARRTRVQSGDLLISVTAYIGSVGLVSEELDEAYVSQHVARCQPSPKSYSPWIGYVLLSTIGQNHGKMRLYGGTKDGLSLDDVKNYPILLPSRSEQEQVVRWIEGKLSSLARTGESTKRQIEVIQEYRTRLITDVVTGKLDAREAAELRKEYVPNDTDESAEGCGIDEVVTV